MRARPALNVTRCVYGEFECVRMRTQEEREDMCARSLLVRTGIRGAMMRLYSLMSVCHRMFMCAPMCVLVPFGSSHTAMDTNKQTTGWQTRSDVY